MDNLLAEEKELWSILRDHIKITQHKSNTNSTQIDKSMNRSHVCVCFFYVFVLFPHVSLKSVSVLRWIQMQMQIKHHYLCMFCSLIPAVCVCDPL